MVRDKLKDRQKSNSVRIFDKDGFLLRASCICVKNEAEDEILLVSSARHCEQWIIPGGGVEPNETQQVAAMREVID
jgi:diphosphoinositol-polyphosphate diphosphatase